MLHCFANVKVRVPETDLAFLHDIEAGKLALLQEAKDIYKETHDSKAYQETTEDLSKQMLEEMCSHLEMVEFNERAWCLICGDYCSINPRSDPEYADAYWTEGTGTTCCPFSAASHKKDKWLSVETLPALIWV
jgi:hypothetical protein